MKIDRFELFDAIFDKVGLKVNPQTYSEKSTQNNKEYIARRFLKDARRTEIFQTPISIRKTHPSVSPVTGLNCECFERLT